jgi:hypothetical protein
MANQPPSTAIAVWNTVLARRAELINSLKMGPHHVRGREDELARVEEQMLNLSAPDFYGIAAKLELLWTEQLHGEDDESRHKLLILDDLHRLAVA